MDSTGGPAARSPRVVVLGDLVLDVVLSPDRPLRRGTDVAGRVTFRQGGSASTTARWFARLGMDAALVTAIGADGPGDALVAYLESRGVRVHAVRFAGSRTGRLGVIVEDGERSFVADRAAMYLLGPRHLRASWFAGIALLHLPSYSLVGERLAAASARAARLAKAQGAFVSVDLSSAGFIASEGPGLMLGRVAALAPDVLLATDSEAAEATAGAGLRPLLDIAPVVVIKSGPGGAVARLPGGMSVRVPVRAMTATDTTGAGDAFDAGFLATLVTRGVDVGRPRERDIRVALHGGHRAARRELAGRRETLAITGLADTVSGSQAARRAGPAGRPGTAAD
jgi:sugar/nucleoside kinase (ribokinase family)